MAKRKISGSESELAATGAAPARQARKRTVKSASTTNPSSQTNGAAASPDITPVTPDRSAAEPIAAVQTVPPATGYAPSFDEIARVAYSYWVARGCQGGSAEDDWLRAERELRTRRSFEANA